jgi:hypothetical protein
MRVAQAEAIARTACDGVLLRAGLAHWCLLQQRIVVCDEAVAVRCGARHCAHELAQALE